jgi:hypothetical protein
MGTFMDEAPRLVYDGPWARVLGGLDWGPKRYMDPFSPEPEQVNKDPETLEKPEEKAAKIDSKL